MSEVYVIVPCSGVKAEGAHLPARERYTGSLHLLATRAALALTDEAHVRIASARYGLLRLDDDTEPYDLRLDAQNLDEARLWRLRVQIAAGDIWNRWCAKAPGAQFITLRPDAPHAVLLTPALYSRRLTEASHFLAKVADLPLEGCAGVGQMRHVLATIITSGQVVA